VCVCACGGRRAEEGNEGEGNSVSGESVILSFLHSFSIQKHTDHPRGHISLDVTSVHLL
jgi:hypothetical protein